MINVIQPLVSEFLPFAKKRMGFKKPPKIFLKNDNQNAKDPLGKTAYYDPENRSVTLYVTNRHPKDVMRSLSHELVHHTQNCNGEFDKVHSVGDGYAQNDEHLREMERQAYEMGNLCFRDWEDGIKNTTYYESLNKGAQINMSTKDWKNKEITHLLSEAWGFKFNSLQEFDEFNGTGEIQKEEEELEELASATQATRGRKGRPMPKQPAPESEDEEEELEERRARGRDREGMAPDSRRRPGPMGESADDSEEVVEEADEDSEVKEEAAKPKTTVSEAKIREILQKAIKLSKARKTIKE